MPGCESASDRRLATAILTAAAGVGYIDTVWPATPAARGFTFFMQSIQLDAPNNALGISMSNDVRSGVGERGF